MKLVILGAGASFDHINYYYPDTLDLSMRPPLANEIFDARAKFKNIIHSYPGAAALMSELNNVTDVEDFFQEKWNFVQNHRAEELLAKLINIQYYLSFLFHQISQLNRNIGNSNFDILAHNAYEYSVAKNEEVAFVSFNYDLLFEQAICKAYHGKNKTHFNKINEYIEKPIKLFKLHGSCNWFSPLHIDRNTVKDIEIADYLYDNRVSYATINKAKGNVFEILENPAYRMNPDRNHYYFPELLVPFKDKDEFILPPEHLNKLKEMLNKVTEVLIIGWKGSEEAFKRLLSQYVGDRNVKVECICGRLSAESKETIKTLFPKANFNFFEESYNLQKYDNTKINFSNSEPEKSLTHHPMGSFSAYTLNVIRKQYKNFFEI